MGRYLDPTNDIAFSKLFQAPFNETVTASRKASEPQPLLISFLNAILELKERAQIQQVICLDKLWIPDVEDNRLSIIDAHCVAENGEEFLLAIQNKWVRAPQKEKTCYVRPSKYAYPQKPVERIVILAISHELLFPGKHEYLSTYCKDLVPQGENPFQAEFPKSISYVYLELPKFTKAENDFISMQDHWIYFFKNWRESKNVPKNLQEQVIIQAYETIDPFRWRSGKTDPYLQADILRVEAALRHKDAYKEKLKGV